MEIQQALEHIDEIRSALSRSQTYRGLRSATVGFSGLVPIVAAAVQSSVLGAAPGPRAFVVFWLGIAALNVMVVGGTVAWNYATRASSFQRALTRQVVGQVVPCVFAGAVATAYFWFSRDARFELLPGLWAMLYGLGVFSARPFLPRAIGWVALFYVLAGGLLLHGSSSGLSLSPWAMGLTFGPGQLAAAVVLYWNLERRGPDGKTIG